MPAKKTPSAPRAPSVSPQPAHPATVAAAADLEALGLSDADREQIQQIADALDVTRRNEVAHFGRDVAEQGAQYADEMLAQVRASQIDAMGGKLAEVVSSAQSLNFHALADKRSKLPLIGGLIDKLRSCKDELLVQFGTAKDNIDRLMNEVTAMQAGLQARIDSLDQGYDAVRREYHQLGLHIAAGQIALERLNGHVAEGQAKATAGQLTPLQSQDLRESIGSVDLLEKRIADMRVVQQSALQAMPMIRMVQANNAMLVEKFHTVKELTLPAWKRQFMLALTLGEQRSAVELAGTIDDATNAFLKDNAELLKQNTVATARANQRLVIDVETLQEVQNTLLSTVQEVITINRDGARHRSGVAEQLHQMREQLRTQLAKSE